MLHTVRFHLNYILEKAGLQGQRVDRRGCQSPAWSQGGDGRVLYVGSGDSYTTIRGCEDLENCPLRIGKILLQIIILQ